MRVYVENFAEAMEAKLQTKDEERGEAGWMDKSCTVRQLKDAMVVEMRELHDAFDNCNSDELAAECVDVANFAMMIHSKLKA
ncbi:MAG: hypothetical protein KUF79_17205 [Candidatus Thiodiazotropha sp. (ex Ctena orbiculata)]|nr:hypothetical protein [Candidatus Thiodiazotropha taylori]